MMTDEERDLLRAIARVVHGIGRHIARRHGKDDLLTDLFRLDDCEQLVSLQPKIQLPTNDG